MRENLHWLRVTGCVNYKMYSQVLHGQTTEYCIYENGASSE